MKALRLFFTVFTLAVLAVISMLGRGCSASPEPVDIYVSGSWQGNLITLDVTTTIPDGASFRWLIVEGDDWDDWDARDYMGEATVDDGGFSKAINVADFTEDMALVELTFAPWATTQPQSIIDMYKRGAVDRQR